jgi:rubrerythrin
MTIDDDIKNLEGLQSSWVMAQEHFAALRRVLEELRRLRSALPRTADGVTEQLELLLLEERQCTARMENDVRKYGEFQADYNGHIREISERRSVLLASRAAALDDGGKQ